MKIEAIYEHGRLAFARPVQFKHERVRLLVEVADDEVADLPQPLNVSPEIAEKAEAMRARLAQIRAAPYPPDDELPPLSAKAAERMAAFALREDR